MTGSQETKSKAAGFTLIELMISASILIVILLALAGVFSSFLANTRRQKAIQTTIEDSRFAFELFKREARTAYATSFTSPSANVVYFRNQNGECVRYQQNTQTQSLERKIISKEAADRALGAEPEFCETLDFENEGESTQTLTSPDVIISELEFNTQNDRRSISVSAFIEPKNKESAGIDISTLVTSRQIIPYDPAQ